MAANLRGGTSGAHRKLDEFNQASDAQKRLLYYELLEVPFSATQSEIIRAFRKLSLKQHPDKPGGSTSKFQALSRAYKCLKDEKSRRKYDECGFDEDNINTDDVDEFVDAFFGESARGVDGESPDWHTNSIENYVRINLAEVPQHMKDIVRIGLVYMVSLEHEFENIVLFQHSRVDILYLMVGWFTEGDLTQAIFDSEESYPITYYDNPLQPGITPRWSDQNVLGGKKAKKKNLPRRELNFEEFQRRQKYALAMLENAPPDPMAALEEKYRAKMLANEHEAERARHAICTNEQYKQDVYEDDAELDYNEFATDRSERLQVAFKKEETCNGEAGYAVVECESQGKQNVLGGNSDGLLFVAKDGKVLRNEGPPRPNGY